MGNKKNYNKMSSKPVEKDQSIEVDAKTAVEDSTTNLVLDVDKENPPVFVNGVVSGCLRLNVRTDPNIKAPIVTTVDACTKVIIDLDKSTDEWVLVHIDLDHHKCTGFCMKKFISIEQ